jgi:hypothetical protein
VPLHVLDVTADPIETMLYALDKRRREYKYAGWVYAMQNPAYREPWLKIGKSRRPPHIRARELGAETGVPDDFHVVHFVHVANRDEAEKSVHEALQRYRVSASKEFFDVPIAAAADALNRVANVYPIVVGGSNGWYLPQYHETFGVRCPHCGRNWRVRHEAAGGEFICVQCRRPLPVEK